MATGNDAEQVRLLFFGQLKERLQCASYTIAIKQPLSIEQLKAHLVSLQPSWQAALNNDLLIAAVNQQIAQQQAIVKGGDEVAFFPPVTGG
ncbi:MAG TPA: molybdopterin converting factor subunit 1 [Pseudoalteromonas prydzensis]|uniref:Molybdopterin synthase sulfur carrier subunit n=1 Tax=Pseudoalteromonas prydzensis TaxID=182141 RepID=A0A7V1D1V3_9GAMM|nr:molybdopterin converting factor subunit 1 [Pseudoalteromonas prydzensis]HEA18362.1 molybdopterin converting factor subunit 1 [Pseudoalteromonas prydzensis]